MSDAQRSALPAGTRAVLMAQSHGRLARRALVALAGPKKEASRAVGSPLTDVAVL